MVRACAVEMHVEISQEPLCQEIYRENAGAQMEHPDQTPAFTLTVRTLSVGTRFGEFLLLQTPYLCGQIAIIAGSTHKFVALIPNIYCYCCWLKPSSCCFKPHICWLFNHLVHAQVAPNPWPWKISGRTGADEIRKSRPGNSWELGRKVWGKLSCVSNHHCNEDVIWAYIYI